MSNLVGDDIVANNANWTFGDSVCESFDDHITKSVPLYNQGHNLIAQLADFFLSDKSVCYDLGCATGQLIAQLAKRNENKNVNFIGIDSEKNMIAKAKENCAKHNNIDLQTSSIMDIDLQKSDLVIAYYTMQFIKPKNRQIIFDRIYNSLNWGGALILFEKVRAPDARFQDITTAIYADYKFDQGFTTNEIFAKSKSLKGVLEPFSTEGNLDLMKRAGFIDIMSIMKYVCFEGFVAIK